MCLLRFSLCCHSLRFCSFCVQAENKVPLTGLRPWWRLKTQPLGVASEFILIPKPVKKQCVKSNSQIHPKAPSSVYSTVYGMSIRFMTE